MSQIALAISEQFFSIQGEGRFTGVPALFLRLKGCNLSCGGPSTIKSKTLENGATWRCDTIEVWTTGKTQSIQSLLDQWESSGWIDQLKKGSHLVITGGEPLLQSEGIVGLIAQLSTRFALRPTIEIETNGTIPVIAALSQPHIHFNISPKLKNSGLSIQNRIHKMALKSLMQQVNILFKFVVSNPEDWEEIVDDFVTPFKIPLTTIMLMPGADTRDTLNALLPLIGKLAKSKNVRCSTRLHIHVWNQKTGV
jgi:7-carboxy-7-deazaguanine synthase